MKDRNKIYLKKRKTLFFLKWSILGYTDTLMIMNFKVAVDLQTTLTMI